MMRSKFGGRPRIQKKPAVCKKAELSPRQAPAEIQQYNLETKATHTQGYLVNDQMQAVARYAGDGVQERQYHANHTTSQARYEILVRVPTGNQTLVQVECQMIQPNGINIMFGHLAAEPKSIFPFVWGPHSLTVPPNRGEIVLTVLT